MQTLLILSDIHLTPDYKPAFGIDTWKQFRLALKAGLYSKPVAGVLAGDICFREGAETIYRELADILGKTGIPWYPASGNHDDSGMMARAFGLEQELREGKLVYQREIAGIQTAFLDSSSGKVDPWQVSWLKEKPAPMVVLHYPPVPSGVRYMDRKYPLENREEARRGLHSAGVRLVISGHCHSGRLIFDGSMTVHLVPSTWYRMNPDSRNFSMLGHEPGWGLLRVPADGSPLPVNEHLLPAFRD
jgi:Icc protein